MLLRVDEVSHVVTDDGWRLAIHHYSPRTSEPRKYPVVLCHGLASNHLAFDVHPELSLARHLAGRGYLTLAVDLRGHGHSERPSLTGARRFGWSFDDYLIFDVPAAVAYAKRVAGAPAIHWIGHSMGGVLGYAHLARGGSADLRSMTVVGSSLDYSGAASGFHALLPLREWLHRVPAVPVDWLARLAAVLAGRVETPFERFNVWPSNVDREIWRRLARSGFHAVSSPVMGQLATALARGGLRSRDGAIGYLEGLAAATAPVLALAGSRDAQCPPEAVRGTLEALASTRRELRVFGKAYGHADEYGHFDLLMGRRAREEVFAHVGAWLDEHDGPLPGE
jgi:alpha-beta hydrolase superfamily lysophospholipase